VRIGVPENYYFDRVDSDVEANVRGLLRLAGTLGAEIRPVRVPDIAALNAVARVILLSEASAVYESQMQDRSKFGPDVLALLDQGRLIPATDYVNAQRLRRRMRQQFAELWRDVDCIVAPATPAAAPKIGQATVLLGGEEEDVRLAATRLARGINVLGLPAVSLPCGLTSAGLPAGAQIIGPAFSEAALIRVGAALEDAGAGVPPCTFG